MNLLKVLHKYKQKKKQQALYEPPEKRNYLIDALFLKLRRSGSFKKQDNELIGLTYRFEPYGYYNGLLRVTHKYVESALEIKLTLIRNDSFVHCRNQCQEMLLTRYFNVVNGLPSTNNICLHSSTKHIVCQYYNVIFGDLKRQMKNAEMVDLLIEYIRCMQNKMLKCIPQIMFLTNQKHPDLDGVLYNTKKRYDFMLNIIKKLEEGGQVYSDKLQYIIWNICNEKPKWLKFANSKMTLTNEYIEKFKVHHPVRAAQTNEKPEVISYVKFIEQPKWELMDYTSFSKLYYSSCSFVYVKDGTPEPAAKKVTKLIVKKEGRADSNPSANRISHERYCLLTIGKLQCINVTRYYFIYETKKKYIFSYFCGFKALDKYKENYHTTLSILTKIFLLCHTVQGLRFLNSNKVVHADVKLANILISKNLTAKICDFADSIFSGRSQCTGITPIFSAPYVYDNSKSKVDSTIDVYSFGIVMFYVLFNQYPYELTCSTTKQFVKVMTTEMKASDRFKIMAERLLEEGTNELMEVLLRTAMMCLDEEPQKRISLDSVIIILRVAMNYLVKLS